MRERRRKAKRMFHEDGRKA